MDIIPQLLGLGGIISMVWLGHTDNGVYVRHSQFSTPVQKLMWPEKLSSTYNINFVAFSHYHNHTVMSYVTCCVIAW